MIRITIIFTLLFIFCFSVSFGQKQTIKLNLQEGKTYVFEQKSKFTGYDRNDNHLQKSIGSAKFAIVVERVNSEKIIFSIKNIKGKSETLGEKVREITDFEFPFIVENINQNNQKFRIFNSLLFLVDLRFELDLKQNSVKQIDKNIMTEKMDSILKIKGYDQKFISDIIDFANNDTVFVPRLISNKNLFLYFNGAIKKSQNEIWSQFWDKEFFSSDNGFEFLSGKNKRTPDTIFEKVKLNEKNGFISSYYTAKTDTAKTIFSNVFLRFSETEYLFLGEYKTKNKSITFRCTIENPKDSIVTLLVLDKAFGEDFTKVFLKLDNNNSVFFRTEIPEQSLFLFATKELKSRITSADFIFYSEPGDTVDLKVTNIENRQDVKISGNRKVVNEVLYNLHRSKELFHLGSGFIKTGNVVISYSEHKQAEKSVEIFNTYLEENNIHLLKHVHVFIENELLATQYLKYFSFLAKHEFSKNMFTRDLGTNKFSKKELTAENIAKQRMSKKMVEDFDIHDIYNDYGIYSRQLSTLYLQYYLDHFGRINRIGTKNSRKNISEEFYQAKHILGGSAFYRVMAGRIVNSMARNSTIFIHPTKYEYNEAMLAINKLINQSYDAYFIQGLKEFRDKRLNWENKDFIPDAEFYQPNERKITLKELMNGKPTVLYVSDVWSRYRYNLDKKAEENPEIQFIMIMEGNDLNKWKEYLKKAEPVAKQLLLIDSEKSLNEIFLRSNPTYIVYDKNGKLLNYDIEEKKAIKAAKQSLSDSKQLNKSQLKILVIILFSLLIFLITGLFIWKWRVRQRFRKEEQSRKLRELELTAIRSQMNPHFLFNSLNSVQNLVQQNKGREAHLYLSDFAGLIRKVLRNSEKEEVSLAEELEMRKQYLNLEKLRFDFNFTITLDEKIDAFNTLVPSMILQPFAENAVIHGLQNKPENRELKIEILKTESGIKISIDDNGIGREAAKEIAKAKNGKGTNMIQERLKILQEKQGEKYSMEIIDLNENGETGTRVEIFIPEEK